MHKITTWTTTALLAGGLTVSPMLAGCEQLPGTNEQQGAVGGGAAGAIIGASVADNSLLGALIGGAVGAGGGYLIGANSDRILGNDTEDAQEAVSEAERDPATVAEARDAETADLNDDGFVTMDELIALEQAGLDDDEIIDRLEATGQVFELTEQQEQELVREGVSVSVVSAMRDLNQDEKRDVMQARQDLSS
jgi:hypothetical protein